MSDGSCDCCGEANFVPDRWDGERGNGSRYCVLCWAKRDNWDEGARATALMAVGNAVALARHWEVPEWAILSAVNISLTDPDGLHPDDAMGLGASRPVDPRRCGRCYPVAG